MISRLKTTFNLTTAQSITLRQFSLKETKTCIHISHIIAYYLFTQIFYSHIIQYRAFNLSAQIQKLWIRCSKRYHKLSAFCVFGWLCSYQSEINVLRDRVTPNKIVNVTSTSWYEPKSIHEICQFWYTIALFPIWHIYCLIMMSCTTHYLSFILGLQKIRFPQLFWPSYYL